MASSKELSSDQFVQLVLKQEWRVRAFAATMLGRPQNLDDVVQEVFAVAWAKRESFRYTSEQPDEEFVRWVCTIGRYEVLKVHRQEAASALLLDEALIEKLVSFQFDESMYLEARRRALTKCLTKLSSKDQRLIRRRYAADESIEQIASADGKTASAIYKSLARIRNSLMACIGRTLSREGF